MGDPTFIYKVVLVSLAIEGVIGAEEDEIKTCIYEASGLQQVLDHVQSNKHYGEIISIEQIASGVNYRNLTK